MRRKAIDLVVALSLASSTLLASGASSMPSPSASARLTPQQEAINQFNSGIEARERAAKLEAELATVSDADRRTKLEGKLRKQYETAVRLQRRATENDPNLFQAFGELGYALRKTGDYAASLAAYDRALTLQPNYAQAIEYRAEAYLGLNRFDDAKAGYMILFNGGDKAGSEKLMTAMRQWVEMRRLDPAGVPAAQLEEVALWVSQRAEIGKQSAGGPGSSWN